MNHAQKFRVLADLNRGLTPQEASFNRNVPIALVREIDAARRDVKRLRTIGFAPEVLWANYQDLLTRSECGVA
jgi:hypothetical protein